MVLSNRQQPQSKEQEQVAAVAAAAEQQNDNGKENKKNEFSRKKGNHIDQMLDRWKCSSARVGVAAGWVIIKRTF